jgi:flagellar hook-associated protein 2
VQVSIVNDLDATVNGIKEFVGKYNEIVQFSNEQSKDPKQESPGLLAGDATIRQIMRSLQQGVSGGGNPPGKYQNLADIGISTNPKTGELSMDEAKVRAALTDNYDSVANLFIRSKYGEGVAERMAQKIKEIRDPGAGALRSKMRSLDTIIQTQDKDIANKERQLGEKEESIKRRFSSLEGQMNNLQSQGQFLAQKLGGGQQSQGGG